MPDLVGHTLGQYRVVEQIGLGGMATVYKAYQPALDRYVAIKILPAYYAHEPGFAERFIREAKAVARLTHPHVLPIYDFGQENGLSYIVMQYVDGGTLKDLLGRPLSPATAADIIEQVADALDYAHEQGIIHRDVKPSNVLMDRRRWVLLSDFGLAKMVEGSVQLTASGVGVGTPAYMAPEQGQGLQVDRRADIYSLGIVLYEMATGRVPFEAETPMAVVVKHITEPLPLPRAVNPDLPEPVERVIMKALAKNPENRYETAGKLAAALRTAVGGLDTAARLAPSVSPALAGKVEGATILEDVVATQMVPPPVVRKAGFPFWAVGAGLAVLVMLLIGGLVLARILGARARQAAGPAPIPADQVSAPATPASSSHSQVTDQPAQEEPPPAGIPLDVDIVNKAIEPVRVFIEQHPPLFADDFGDPDSGWNITEDQHGRVGYQDGTYMMQVPEAGGRNKLSVRLPFDRPLADFVLQVDVTAVKGGPGANWVIEFRAQESEKALYAGLSAQPRGFGIGYVSPEGETALERGFVQDYRPFQMTQATLVARGPDIMLFLDDRPVGLARTDLTQPGLISLNVINTGDPAVAYQLDNLRLWDLAPLSGKKGKPDGAVLHRFHRQERGPIVADGPIVYRVDQWHEVEVIAQGGHIELVLDGKKILAYDDPDPLPPGLVAFENGDPPVRNLIDEVVVEPVKP